MIATATLAWDRVWTVLTAGRVLAQFMVFVAWAPCHPHRGVKKPGLEVCLNKAWAQLAHADSCNPGNQVACIHEGLGKADVPQAGQTGSLVVEVGMLVGMGAARLVPFPAT